MEFAFTDKGRTVIEQILNGKERLWCGPCWLEMHAQGDILITLALPSRLEFGVEVQAGDTEPRVRSMYVICEAMDFDEFIWGLIVGRGEVQDLTLNPLRGQGC